LNAAVTAAFTAGAAGGGSKGIKVCSGLSNSEIASLGIAYQPFLYDESKTGGLA